MRSFSLLFVVIAVVVLVQFLAYVVLARPIDPTIAGVLFVSFLACAVPALYLLRPFENREELQRRRDRFRKRREAEKTSDRDNNDRDGA
ncbi:hypothetical protein [Rubrobacter indicoceani]|uniref:hypothetical protein n=1 Tax=Rubrobacter indicoceani TaxID=2051957 RepID=UPI000E5C227B|nr:hypothetical protein [Rubrobacter indicoceani]